jgi:putative flavoprotein involved in K+ transport
VQVPVFAGDGRVEHRRGVTAIPGLYFLGLSWLYTRGSALLGWVKDDAQYIAGRIAEHAAMSNGAASTRAATEFELPLGQPARLEQPSETPPAS